MKATILGKEVALKIQKQFPSETKETFLSRIEKEISMMGELDDLICFWSPQRVGLWKLVQSCMQWYV